MKTKARKISQKLRLKQLFRLKHHRHSGKRLKHSETSYAGLVLLLLLTGLAVKPVYPLLSDTLSASGLVHIGVTVPGPAPSDAPNIASPADHTTFSVPLISLSGTCDVDLTVKVFNNNNFAGSTLCTSNGDFSLGISLSPGTNALVAYIYDNLDQAGPPSTTVTVFYNPPVAASDSRATSGSSDTGAQSPPLVLTTTFGFNNLEAGQVFSWDQLLSGGVPPYSLSVNWGDGTSNVYSNLAAGPFQLSHTYSQPGTYHISMRLQDTAGQISILNIVAVVNGPPAVTKFEGHGQASNIANSTSNLYDTVVSMLYKVSLLVVAAFWGIEGFVHSALGAGVRGMFGSGHRLR